ncbi:MAG TPA: (2Fe-2S)-binding protein [bacterium]|nr:(2Fe-2S)-binding protein [bacterium]HOL66586.1 (2Fe-2S)-binding protein [bacterium]HPP11487.1 (2Fe-2S)-binding protein [bacterium]
MRNRNCGNPIVCRCEEVREKAIVEAIRNGAHDVDAVRRVLRAGMGLCQGKTCGPLIARLIARETGKSMPVLLPARARPPVRPVKIRVLSEK